MGRQGPGLTCSCHSTLCCLGTRNTSRRLAGSPAFCFKAGESVLQTENVFFQRGEVWMTFKIIHNLDPGSLSKLMADFLHGETLCLPMPRPTKYICRVLPPHHRLQNGGPTVKSSLSHVVFYLCVLWFVGFFFSFL